MKKNSILLIIIGLLVIVFGLVNPLNLGKEEQTETNNSSNNSNNTNETKKEEPQITIFNGVYAKDKTTMTLFAKNNKLSFDIVTPTGVISGDAEISGSSAEGSIMDNNYKFTLSNNNIILETNDTSLESGEYTKTKDYTINDYYTANYGELDYASSEINGLYEKNNSKLYVYQKSATTVSFIVESGDNYVSSDCQQDANGNYTATMFDDTYTLKIDKDTVVVTSTETSLNGQYIKKQSLTMEEIINKF